jgi:hypothetical protein
LGFAENPRQARTDDTAAFSPDREELPSVNEKIVDTNQMVFRVRRFFGLPIERNLTQTLPPSTGSLYLEGGMRGNVFIVRFL